MKRKELEKELEQKLFGKKQQRNDGGSVVARDVPVNGAQTSEEGSVREADGIAFAQTEVQAIVQDNDSSGDSEVGSDSDGSESGSDSDSTTDHGSGIVKSSSHKKFKGLLQTVNKAFNSDTSDSDASHSGGSDSETSHQTKQLPRGQGISLLSDKRLRKLRKHAKEDVISTTEYEQRLRAQFKSLHPQPAWAKKAQDQDEAESDDEVQMKIKLSDHLNITRLKSLGKSDPIKSIAFHPHAHLFAVGMAKKVDIHVLDGLENPLVQSLVFQDCPVSDLLFLESSLVILGPRPFFYSFDLEHSKVHRHLLVRGAREKSSTKTIKSCIGGQMNSKGDTLAIPAPQRVVHIVRYHPSGGSVIVAQLKANAKVVQVKWTDDLWVLTADNRITAWDVTTKTRKRVVHDQNTLNPTSFDLAGDVLALGQQAGFTYIYSITPDVPVLLKSIKNLTTKISQVTFNSNASLALLASNEKKDAFRIYDVATKTVYKNWPTAQTPLGKVTVSAWSPSGQYLMIGNVRGKISLYRLKAFTESR